MRKLLSTLVLTTALGLLGSFASPAYAHCGSCGGDHAEKTAKAEKMEACGDKDKAGCSGPCGNKDDVAKGGADENKASYGYKLGDKVPAFTLTDTKGKKHDLAEMKGKPVMLVFYNQQCPYVVEMEDRFNAFAKEYKDKDVQILAIDAGTNNSAESVKKHAEAKIYPVALNPKQDLAVKFEATRTPEVFLLDKQGKIVYHGMFDTGQNVDEDGKRTTYAKNALDAVLAGNEPEVKETKAFGCRIRVSEENRKAATEPNEVSMATEN